MNGVVGERGCIVFSRGSDGASQRALLTTGTGGRPTITEAVHPLTMRTSRYCVSILRKKVGVLLRFEPLSGSIGKWPTVRIMLRTILFITHPHALRSLSTTKTTWCSGSFIPSTERKAFHLKSYFSFENLIINSRLERFCGGQVI